ncbi:MAG: hypothetical protein N2053_13360, partial [Chitinispirillaceae bacterium]|nr:hypothetical protein [Chitinispirillaceae bacterium]
MSRIFGNSFFNSNNFEENFLSNIAANILCCNNINTATKQKYKDFIGISSFSGSVVQLRKIKEDYNIRYLTLKTTKVLPENYFVVNLGNKIGNRTLILAEGVFTLLRGYLYLKNIGYIDNNNIILVATFGKNNFIKEVCNPQILKYYNQVIALLDSDVT